MFNGLLFILSVLAVCQGNSGNEEIANRNGNFNSYYFFNRFNPLQAIHITDMTAAQLAANFFNPQLITVFIIHGHGGTAFTTLNPIIKNALMTNKDDEDVNVIVVDWSVFAGQSYSNAANAVPTVGLFVANFIRRVLMPFQQFSLSKLHLVGFNLGAHVAGFTARQFPAQVGRITGLDPSGNQWGSNSGRLHQNDALYVEVIHTDGRGRFANGIGEPLGHIDFYVNGGTNQPGCHTNSCSHNRAYEVFAASLTNGKLYGHSCNTDLQVSLNTCRGATVEMGTNRLIKFGRGIYRANTGRRYPFQ